MQGPNRQTLDGRKMEDRHSDATLIIDIQTLIPQAARVGARHPSHTAATVCIIDDCPARPGPEITTAPALGLWGTSYFVLSMSWSLYPGCSSRSTRIIKPSAPRASP